MQYLLYNNISNNILILFIMILIILQYCIPISQYYNIIVLCYIKQRCNIQVFIGCLKDSV